MAFQLAPEWSRVRPANIQSESAPSQIQLSVSTNEPSSVCNMIFFSASSTVVEAFVIGLLSKKTTYLTNLLHRLSHLLAVIVWLPSFLSRALKVWLSARVTFPSLKSLRCSSQLDQSWIWVMQYIISLLHKLTKKLIKSVPLFPLSVHVFEGALFRWMASYLFRAVRLTCTHSLLKLNKRSSIAVTGAQNPSGPCDWTVYTN